MSIRFMLRQRQKATALELSTIGITSDLFWMPPRDAGHVYAAAEIAEIPRSKAIRGIKIRPGWANDTRNGVPRVYGTGAWSVNIVIDEYLRLSKQGIPAPNMKPAVAAVGGGTLFGNFVPYYRYLDGWTGRYGPLSTPGDIVSCDGTKQRSWSNLPQEADVLDLSVTHVQGFIDDGTGVAREAWTREVGVPAALTEQISILALGEAAPLNFQAMPACRRSLIYHDVQAAFGNTVLPERLFISATGRMEHWEGTFVDTNGEPVVGAFCTNDVIIYGSFECVYRTQGYVASDFRRQVEKPDIGFLGPDGFASAHGRVIVPTNKQIYLYDGSWHPLLDDREQEWRREIKLFPDDYRDAQGFYDPVENVYTFGPVRHSELNGGIVTDGGSGGYAYWVLNCENLFPEAGAGAGVSGYRADWAADLQFRPISAKAVWNAPSSPTPIVVSGAPDDGTHAYLREENYAVDVTDDGDFFSKVWIVEPGMMQIREGGFPSDGTIWQKAWTYMESRWDPNMITPDVWEAQWRSGGPHCHRAPHNTDLVFIEQMSAEQEQELVGVDTFLTEPQTLFHHVLEGRSGQCLCLRIYVGSAPATMKFCGWGATATPGLQSKSVIFQALGG